MRRVVTLPPDMHLDAPIFSKSNNVQTLVELEDIFQILDSYLWLSNKFNHLFVEYDLCCMLREQVALKISEILSTTASNRNMFVDTLF